MSKKENDWGNLDDNLNQSLVHTDKEAMSLHPSEKAIFYREVEKFARQRAEKQEAINERFGVPE